jgi:phosphatidylglycerol:prolipoprotein diacylglycerol transferase
MPSIALAQGFGRIGCIFAGCCYGEETKSSFHILFHDSTFAPNNVQLLPTQPISSVLNFINFIALVFISKHVKADGQVAGFYLIFYSAGRFIIEFFRGDLERGKVGILTTSQFISIILLVIGLSIVIIRGIQARKKVTDVIEVHDVKEEQDL